MLTKKYIYQGLALACSAMLLAGCNDDEPTVQGIMSPAIAGISFKSDDVEGVTAEDGSFSYVNNSSVTFSLGALELGTLKGADTLNLAEVIGADSDNTYDETMVELLRVLMELDEDDNVYDGISVVDADTSELPVGQFGEVDLSDVFERVGSAKVYAWLAYEARHDYPELSAGNHHTLARSAEGIGFSFGESYGGFIYGEDPNRYCDTQLRFISLSIVMVCRFSLQS